jgi:stage II sporulation protein AA (anti-sigma F factor antagonist)
MDFTVWSENDRLYLKLSGEIDHHAVTRTRREVDMLISKKRPKMLIMDLSEIDFMDSSGLGFVLGRLRKMKDIGGGVLVLDPEPRARDMLMLAGADKLIKIAYSDGAGA